MDIHIDILSDLLPWYPPLVTKFYEHLNSNSWSITLCSPPSQIKNLVLWDWFWDAIKQFGLSALYKIQRQSLILLQVLLLFASNQTYNLLRKISELDSNNSVIIWYGPLILASSSENILRDKKKTKKKLTVELDLWLKTINFMVQ